MTCIDCGRTIVGRLIVVCPDCVQVRRENPHAQRVPAPPGLIVDRRLGIAWYDEGETIIGTFGPAELG